MEEDEFSSSDEDDEPPAEGEVVIKFSSELKRRIRAPWSALSLLKSLDALWVKFENRDDFEDVLRNGPWFIGETFLSIRPWVPDFRASDASVSSVAVWVRLPELPVEYYHKDSSNAYWKWDCVANLGTSKNGAQQVLRRNLRVLMNPAPATSTPEENSNGFGPMDTGNPLSFEDSFTAVAGAPIKAISGGGVQCNTNRVRREESITITLNSASNGRGMYPRSKLAQTSKVCTQIRDSDQKLRIEGGAGFLVLPFQDGNCHEHHLGDMAREGLEFAGRRKEACTRLLIPHLCRPTKLALLGESGSCGKSAAVELELLTSTEQGNSCLGSEVGREFHQLASRIAEYNNCMNTCSMLDLGFSGPKYTWSNGQDISTLIMQRLDRAWVNSEWRILFPEAYVTHLTRTHSDHCPILLSLWPSSHNSLPRPFRFENIWLSHPEFPTVVDKAWAAPCPNLSSTFDLFTSLVTTWNKNTFGNIFQRKKRILARINGMQCALATNPSEASARLEKSLRMEYGNILKLEEDFWALKSRVGWVVEGDRNTKFFHTTTLVRRRYNKIVRIRNNMGDWIVDSQLIRNHIQQAEALNLTTTVLPLEIKESLWSLKPFKAPGPDGLHPGFFQHCWHQVGDSVSKEVIQIVTKIIVSRIRPILNNLISPYQTAFVPGRRGVDNVIIAQELIHTIQKKKGSLALQTLVDIWDFLLNRMVGILESPNFIVERVQAKLSNWKAKLLSPAGRLVLIQAVTSAVPAYYMQSTALPSRNVALLAKLNWRLLQEKDALWARTILAKYSPNGVMEIDKRLNRCGSSTWRGIKKGHEVFRKGLRWVVNVMVKVFPFWHDKWVGDKPIRDVIQGPLLSHEDSFRLFQFVPLRQQEDCIAWDSRNGDFCLKLAYLLACKPPAGYINDSPSNWIWKVPTSPRICFFLWQCYHNSVPVRETLVARGINIPNTCPRIFLLFNSCSIIPDPVANTIAFASELFCLMGKVILGLLGVGGLSVTLMVVGLGVLLGLLGLPTSVQAELRALKDGLMLAIDLGIPYLAIEMDSLVAVEFVNSKTMPNVFLSAIVE
uniref:DUF4283 domain-containing protein n=1 Tax=Fagus sylvatica TaxID=28930 RepID=A0A2N9GZ20_FAGSY